MVKQQFSEKLPEMLGSNILSKGKIKSFVATELENRE